MGELTCRFEIEISVPRELFPFGSSNDIERNTFELPQRCHCTPHPLLDHLAERESFVGQSSPTSLETNFKHRSKDSTSRLSHVDHVGNEGESIEFQLRDVSLKENVDLGRRIVDTLLDRNRYTFEKLGEFESAQERQREISGSV